MATTMTLIAKQTAGANNPSSITFSNIPQTYTDLKLVMSWRSSGYAQVQVNGLLTFNGETSRYYDLMLYSPGTSLGSVNRQNAYPYITWSGTGNGASSVANSFSNSEIYIPNYRSSTIKAISFEGVQENNTTDAWIMLDAAKWDSAVANTAITSITITAEYSAMAEFSTFYLYGISNNVTTQNTNTPYAYGGDVITTDGTYWYHAFKYSGTFVPQKNLTADVLVVAGGGAGGGAWTNNSGTAAGGGAGGLRALTAQAFTSATSYTCTIGAGGTNTTNSNTRGTNGGNSSIAGSGFTTISATGGGAGGGGDAAPNVGASGGSGGGTSQTAGGGVAGGSGNAGSYSPVEGYAGGAGTNTPGTNGSGGGGGAGAVGVNGGSASGAGGIGFTSSLTNAMGAATVTGQLSSSNYYYAGGGGGGGSATPTSAGTGGLGGGGSGGGFAGDGVTGTANTGGGGGSMGASNSSGTRVAGNGGSGIIIVRYAV